MDPHAFFRRAENQYYEDFGACQSHFNPRPCDFMVFKHNESQEVVVEQGLLQDGDDVLAFLDRPRHPEVSQELRIIFTPARQDGENLDFEQEHLGSAIPFPKAVLEHMVNRFHFHKTCFEKLNRDDVSRMVIGSVTSLFLSSWRHLRGKNIKVFISSDSESRITTVFAHDGLPHEIELLRARLQEPCLAPLTIHPMLLLVFIMETMVDLQVYRVDGYFFDAISRLPPFTDGGEVPEISNVDFVKEPKDSLYLQHKCNFASLSMEMIRHILGNLIAWSKEYEINSWSVPERAAFKEAEGIICHRLEDLLNTVRLAERLLRTTKAYNEVYRQSLDVKIAEMGNQLSVRIAAQSRDIALDSRRDSSAMKAIAVLTMLFLPGTFIAACFAMPLFDWEAPTAFTVVKSRFWIYVVITVPTTTAVLATWRVWYRFEEWKQWHRTGEDRSSLAAFMKEFWKWMRSGRPRQTVILEDAGKNYSCQ